MWRRFFGSGQTRIQLFNVPVPSQLVSQLTYSNLTANAGEIFGRVEHLSGFFLKGYLGASALNSGNLKYEVFSLLSWVAIPAPIATSTVGPLKYATVDFGWDCDQKICGSAFLKDISIMPNI